MATDIDRILSRSNQTHIFQFLDCLPATERQALIDDIARFDLVQLAALHAHHQATCQAPAHQQSLQTVEALRFTPSPASQHERRRMHAIGEDCLRQGRVALFLVAGGQATRLGLQGPKGCYPLTPVRQKSLFQLYAEGIRALQLRYGRPLPWYIMTSEDNNAATKSFFEHNGFFGLEPDRVRFLVQQQIPSLDIDGRLIVGRNGKLFTNPNGHGGSLQALHDSGALADLAAAGIEEIFYFQVDNPLARIADPLFIGAHLEQRADMSTKVVSKTDPHEKVGIIGRIDGRLGCIEYSELSPAEACQRSPDGSLRFSSANIAIHVLNRRFVEKLVCQAAFSLPYHCALKQIECLAVDKGRLCPLTIQGLKFEMFIFDALARDERSVTREVSRAEEFAPIKNRDGADSPATARRAMISLHTAWLRGAAPAASLPDDLVIEVSPLYACDAESFQQRFVAPAQLSSPLYFE